MTDQPSLFDQPELLPTLPGRIQGIVGKRDTEDGRYAWDLQCQRCFAVETPKHLIIMRFKFPACTEQTYGQRTRICPDCHQEICTGHSSCRGMPGMRGHHD